MQRGRGAPFLNGDLTAESIVGSAIPLRRDAGRIPADCAGPLLHGIRRPDLRLGIDSKENATNRRRADNDTTHTLEEAVE